MASESFVLAAPAAQTRRALSRETIIRFVLCAVGVALCYRFGWHWLRAFTCTANLRADSVFGVYLHRTSAEEVLFAGQTYYYAIACTLADVWCGALPLLWDFRKTISDNLRDLGLFSAGLFAFNIARLSISDLLVAHGASWTWGHSVFCGCAYFFVWLWVCRPGTPLQAFWPFNRSS